MHVAWGQQLLLGDWPGRDFVEPGMPLVVALSALGAGGLARIPVGGGAGHRDGERGRRFHLRNRRRRDAIDLPRVSWRGCWWQRRTRASTAIPSCSCRPWRCGWWRATSGATRREDCGRSRPGRVVAFLLRHDLGIVTAAAMAVALAVDSSRGFGARATTVASFVGMGLLIVSPYLIYVQVTEGLAEHVRVGLEFGKAEQHQVLWGVPSLDSGRGRPRDRNRRVAAEPRVAPVLDVSGRDGRAHGVAGELEADTRAAAGRRALDLPARLPPGDPAASASGAPARCGGGGGIGGRDRGGRAGADGVGVVADAPRVVGRRRRDGARPRRW